jgi:hypothetical protein
MILLAQEERLRTTLGSEGAVNSRNLETAEAFLRIRRGKRGGNPMPAGVAI